MKISYELGCPRDVRLISLMYSDDSGFTTEPKEYQVDGARLRIHMGKTSAIVLKMI